MKLDKKGWFSRQGKHPLLHHSALDIIILDDYVLLKNLDGIQFICSFSLSKHHLPTEMKTTNYQHILESGHDNNYHLNALMNVANSEKYKLTVT